MSETISEAMEHPNSIALLNDLNYQQELFVTEWLRNGMNGRAAATLAQYSSPDQTASRLLNHPKVVAYIEAVRAEERAARDLVLRERHLTPDKLLALLADMADFDLGEAMDDQGRVDRAKLKRISKQLQSVEIDGGKTKIKGPDRMAAIRLIADILNMTKQTQVNVQVNVGFAERMAARRARVLED